MKTVTATLVLAAALGACAPAIVGGPPMALTPPVRDGARLGAVYMSSDWLRSEEDFADTFTDEITEELRLCMQGGSPVDVRVHIDDIDRAGRLETLLNG